jgi:hypothetical protein
MGQARPIGWASRYQIQLPEVEPTPPTDFPAHEGLSFEQGERN